MTKKKSLTDDMPVIVKVVSYIFTCLMSVLCLVPMLLTLSVSFTEERQLAREGYSLIPKVFSVEAYRYIFQNSSQVWHSYGVTIFITVIGTLFGVFIMSMFAYAISRQYFPWRNQLSFFVYFTMLFSGGMIATYIVVTTILNLRDNILVLILPCCVSAMYIIIIRTYMRTSIPDSIVESAKIDGAGDLLCYFKIVIPMSVPVLSTIMFFLAVSYWNNWYTAFLYVVRNDDIIPIQLLLKRIENDISFLATAENTMSSIDSEQLRQSLPSESFKMALTMMIAVPITVAYPFFQRFFVKGITVGAVKG